MKTTLEQLGVALCGLITTVIVVSLNGAILHLTGWNLAGTSFNLIPIGAIGAGLIAASGYYFAAAFTHTRAGRPLLLLMVFIAAFASVLTYVFQYGLDGGSGSSFLEYVDSAITHTRVVFLGRAYHFGTGEVGWIGYLLAAREFIGFLIGGFVAYSLLRSRESCPSCNVYLTEVWEKHRYFKDVDAYGAFLNPDGVSPDDSAADENAATGPTVGSVDLVNTLHQCPFCKFGKITGRTRLYDGKDWQVVDGSERSYSLEVESVSAGGDGVAIASDADDAPQAAPVGRQNLER